jgi:hypothetical protein
MSRVFPAVTFGGRAPWNTEVLSTPFGRVLAAIIGFTRSTERIPQPSLSILSERGMRQVRLHAGLLIDDGRRWGT